MLAKKPKWPRNDKLKGGTQLGRRAFNFCSMSPQGERDEQHVVIALIRGKIDGVAGWSFRPCRSYGACNLLRTYRAINMSRRWRFLSLTRSRGDFSSRGAQCL